MRNQALLAATFVFLTGCASYEVTDICTPIEDNLGNCDEDYRQW